MRPKNAAGLVLLAGAVFTGACVQPTEKEQVTVYRDRSGVPHVFAKTAEAVYHGGGYVLAQDRLAEFERARRFALGRMAEIDPSRLEDDSRARAVTYTEADTQAAFEGLAPEYQRTIRAHLAGMNRAIDEALADPEHKMPYEFGVLWEVPRPPTAPSF